MSPADAATFHMDAYTTPGLITAVLDTNGDPRGSSRKTWRRNSGEFVSAEKWSAVYVAASLPLPSNIAVF